MSSVENTGNLTSGENRSYWVSSVGPVRYKKLQEDIDTDVLVIGGGIAGLTTAYFLLQENLKVVLVEDGFIGSGETGRTTAHISYALDDHFSELERIFGVQKAALAGSSHMAAISQIAKIINDEQISCHFKRVPGYLFLSDNDKYQSLDIEYEAVKKAGLPAQMLDHIPGIFLTGDTRCIMFPDQGQFHPMKYIKGLAEAVVRKGGEIYTETRAEDISEKGTKANGFEIRAKHIVVATNTPVNDWFLMHTKQYAYRTYVIAARIPKNSLPYALWWDTGDKESKWVSEPYHYVRLEEYDNDHDLLISGGEDHRVGQADKEGIPEEARFLRLLNWTRQKFPEITDMEYNWSGQIMEPVDSLAFIGRNPGNDNVYIITGDSGDGITNGTIGGVLVTDLIMGRDNPWADLYNPSRKTIKTTGDYLKEAGSMTAQYADWIGKGDIKGSEDLKAGEGAIMSSGLKKYAVYRDEQNNLHAFSAVCPHMGGILSWNAFEKSFDCPVHGSRFTTSGNVMNGPAVSDLKRVEIRDNVSEQTVENADSVEQHRSDSTDKNQKKGI